VEEYMNSKTYRWLVPLVVVAVLVIWIVGSFSGNYNRMVALEEAVNAGWAQVENVYQRRYDLIPNLVETVRAYAEFEAETLQAVTDARSRLGGVINVSPELLEDPAAFERFSQAQSELGSALQRLMVVTEDYPDLKANENFLALQDQLEGTENRIAVERRRFNEVTRSYNTFVKQFPRVIIANMAGFGPKAYFEASEGAQEAPRVEL
jgi:LemA protein